MKLKNNRGQVTIFIIVAIILVAVIGLYFLIRAGIVPPIIGEVPEENPETFIRDCIEENMKNNINSSNFKEVSSVRILGRDPKGKAVKISIDNLDDLWHLYNIIEEHDLVGGETYRRQDKADDKLRPDKSIKKRVWLVLDVDRLEFHEFSNRLRVHGMIARGPEELGLKSHHTLNFTSGNRLELEKPDGWKQHQKDQLKNAVEASHQPQVTIIAMEDDNAVIALLHQYGVRDIATIHTQGMGKLYDGTRGSKGRKKFSETRKEFFDNILLQLSQVRPENSPLIVVGPGFTKDEFIKYCKEKNLPDMSNMLVETTGKQVCLVYKKHSAAV